MSALQALRDLGAPSEASDLREGTEGDEGRNEAEGGGEEVRLWMALWLLIAAVVLEVIALTIGLRNRSPYRNTPVDDRTRSLLCIAQYVLVAGFVCSWIGYALRYWRLR
jgi:hypothetical protein